MAPDPGIQFEPQWQLFLGVLVDKCFHPLGLGGEEQNHTVRAERYRTDTMSRVLRERHSGSLRKCQAFFFSGSGVPYRGLGLW